MSINNYCMFKHSMGQEDLPLTLNTTPQHPTLCSSSSMAHLDSEPNRYHLAILAKPTRVHSREGVLSEPFPPSDMVSVGSPHHPTSRTGFGPPVRR